MALQIVGAGLGRTGTASIKVALEQLGIGRCYHMGAVMENPSVAEHWVEAANGNPNWDVILEGFSAAVDYPACAFWQELAAFYPDSKVLLSVRDANSWFESTRDTIFSSQLREWAKSGPFGHFLERTVWADFQDKIADRKFMTTYFDERVEHIKAALPPERLLVYTVKDGWGPLCEFLQLPVPDGPFPRVNSREETAQMISTIIGETDGRSVEEVLQEHSQDLFESDREPS